ncbi:hypothetical protein COLO4_04291 [Corchorus olitorius]|uniref:General substrate transporter (ISS) n=2 Tax=Corchorus olitorius TaxID=93759 RepID=A0A1R3KUJ0_9ROSI|nr:hypothetical protein COLO4_04291 [Corchorus olitorius]
MAANTQQFGSREDYSRESNTRRINEVSTHSTSLEQQLQETNQQVAALTDLCNADFSSVPKICGICKQGHYTDKCPSLEHTAQEVNVVGMHGAYQRKLEPYWRAEQPSQQYENQGNYQGRPMNYQRPNFQQSSQVVEMQQLREAMEMMRKQISQLASDMSELKTQGQQRIPSQPKSASLLHFELEVRKSQQPVTTRPSACLRTAMTAPASTFVVCFEWQS